MHKSLVKSLLDALVDERLAGIFFGLVVVVAGPIMLLYLDTALNIDGCIALFALIGLAGNYAIVSIGTMKRFEATSRSEMINHLSNILTDVATIRSARKRTDFAFKFQYLQDEHSSCWFIYCSQ